MPKMNERERLPLHEKAGYSGLVEFKWYGSFWWKIFGKKIIHSEVLPFFPIGTKFPEICVPFVHILGVRLLTATFRLISRNFVPNGTAQPNPYPWCGIAQFHLYKKIYLKFHSNGKRSGFCSFFSSS